MPPAHNRESGAEPKGEAVDQANKFCSKEAIAHPSVAAASPSGAGLIVLQTLALFRHPLAPREIAQRAQLPLRTVYYWLSKFLKLGYVERIGKPRSPGVLYALTREGRRALTRSRALMLQSYTGQARTKPRMQNLQNGSMQNQQNSGSCSNACSPAKPAKPVENVKPSGASLSGRVRLSGLRARAEPERLVRRLREILRELRGIARELEGLGFVLRLPLVPTLDGSPHGRLEAALRGSYPPVRDYLRSLGVGMPQKRVKSIVFYASKGVVHCDMPISPDVLSAVDGVENVLLLEAHRGWLAVAVGTAKLTALGYPRELVALAALGIIGYFVAGLDGFLAQNPQNA